MSDVVSYAEIYGQHLELLPGRTLLQTAAGIDIMDDGGFDRDGGIDDNGGPNDDGGFDRDGGVDDDGYQVRVLDVNGFGNGAGYGNGFGNGV